MRFVTIEPAAHLISVVDCRTYKDAIKLAGLTLSDVDHGKIDANVAIVVSQFAMFADPDKQHYFSFDGRLYAGNALLYSYETGSGETRDMPDVKFAPIFLHGRAEVEAAIANGIVVRPELTVNSRPVWRWPDPSPFEESNSKGAP